MGKNYCITLDDERAREIGRGAAEQGIPAASYLRSIIERSIPTKESKPAFVDYPALLQKMYESAMKMKIAPDRNNEFCLRDIEEFGKLCVVSAKKGKVSVETVRASVGRQWNSAIANDKFKGITRAKDEKGKLKFMQGAAVYKRKVEE